MGGLLLALVLGVVAADGPDPAVARALALLGTDAPTAPIVVVNAPTLRGNPQRAVAATDGKTIRVYTDSGAYKRARKGDAIALAGALAHEAFHIAHGPAEAPAYARQLEMLRMLGARRRDVEPVERAARHVTRRP
jgi:hypothetical protein